MVPVTIKLRNHALGRKDEFNLEVFHHRRFTPFFVLIGLLSTLSSVASDADDATLTVTGNIELDGYKPIRLTEHFFSQGGVVSFRLLFTRAYRAMNQLIRNRFKDVKIKSVRFEVDVNYSRDKANIESVRIDQAKLEPGKKASVIVTLKKLKGARFEVQIPFTVPTELEGRRAWIQVSGGRLAHPVLPPPDKIEHLINNLKNYYDERTLVLTITLPERGLAFKGQKLVNLPASALEVLRTTLPARTISSRKRVVKTMPLVIDGARSLSIMVKKRVIE